MWMTKLRKIVALNLIRLMDAQGIKQQRLAQLSGVGQTTISKLLRQKASPTLDTLEALAKALRVNVRDLLNPEIDPGVAADLYELDRYMAGSSAGGRKVVLAVAERESMYRSGQRNKSDTDPPALTNE